MAIENPKFGKGIALAGGFDLGAKAPLDSRYTVATIEERDAHVTGNRAYEGMLVFVEADKKTYQYVANSEGNLSWVEFGFNADKLQAEIVDNLTTDDATKILSAKQGKVLNEKIGTVPTSVEIGEETRDTANVIEYVNAKAEQVLAAASGNSTEIAASVKQQLDSYKTSNDARVETLETDVNTIKTDYLTSTDKTELQGKIDLKADQSALEAEIARAQAAEKANADAIERLTNGVSQEEIDSVNDLIDYVNEHGATVEGLQQGIADNAAAIEDHLKVDHDFASADAALKSNLEGQIANKADQTALDATNERVTTAEGKITDLEAKFTGENSVDNKITSALSEAKEFAINKANAAETAANQYADSLNNETNTRVGTVESKVSALEGNATTLGAKVDTNTTDISNLKIKNESQDAQLTALEEKAHTHNNHALLESITQTNVDEWNGAKEYTDEKFAEIKALTTAEILAIINPPVEEE